MRAFCKAIVHFMKREDGPTAAEYAVMLAVIVVVYVAGVLFFGNSPKGVPRASTPEVVAPAEPEEPDD